jgi:GNAT superfamily N-acetyltransferase
MQIVLAGEKDAELIAAIIQKSYQQQAAQLNLNPVQHHNYAGFETEDKCQARLRSGDYVCLAYVDDRAIGTISYQLAFPGAQKGYIKRFAVLPPYRGRDYGRQLMHHAEMGLLALGAARAEISIVAQFKPLYEYYLTLGYQKFEQRNVPNLPFGVIFMFKNISDMICEKKE